MNQQSPDALRRSLQAHLPLYLQRRPQWVCWKWIQRDGETKRTKIPVQPVADKDHPKRAASASSTDPDTWHSFEQCLAGIGRFGIVGVGYVFDLSDGFTGLDFDDCLNPNTGEVHPETAALLAPFIERGAYAEISPSGTGVKIICTGRKPGKRCKHTATKREIYNVGRFFTTTGRVYPGSRYDLPEPIDCQDLVTAFYEHHFPAEQERQQEARHRTTVPLDLDDRSLINAMFSNPKNGHEIQALWHGAGEGADHSSLDLKLCYHLAYYTGGDPHHMDRLFRQSGLFRPKWDEMRGPRTYGEGTIAEALSNFTGGGYPAKEAAYRANRQHITASTSSTRKPADSTTAGTPTGLPTADEAMALTEQLVASVSVTKSVPEVFAAVPILALLDNASVASTKARLREILGKGLNLNDFDAAIRGARKQHRQPRDLGGEGKLPRIQVNDRQLRHVVRDALGTLQAANDPPQLFQRGGTLVQLGEDENQRPIIRTTGEAEIRMQMSLAADYFTESQDGSRGVSPPRDAAQSLLSLGKWPFPALFGITETPILRADGSVLTIPGYDPATSMLYAPAPGFQVPPIPDNPTPGHIAQAVHLLTELLYDFPFAWDAQGVSENSASFANTFAALLTPIIRQGLQGNAPLVIIDATRAGTGKGLLASIINAIPTGRTAAVTTAPTTEEEWGKTITAQLASGNTLINIDNLEAPLSSAKLAAALTSETWIERLLGRTEIVSLPQRATWIATGNNVQLGGDIPRRIYRIRLDAEMARPWVRSGFRHENLVAWTLEHRGELIAALLTLARAWFAAGQPRPLRLPTKMGGFEAWCSTIGGILEHAGIEGFLENQDDLWSQADTEANEWEAFLSTLATLYPDAREFTIKDLTYRLHESSELRTTLPDELIGEFAQGDATFTRKLGWAFKRHVGTRYGNENVHLERGGQDNHAKVSKWKVLRGFSGTPRRNPAAHRHECGVSGVSSSPCAHASPPTFSITAQGQGGVHTVVAAQNPQNPAAGTNGAGFYPLTSRETPHRLPGLPGTEGIL